MTDFEQSSLCIYFHRSLDQIFASIMILNLESVLRIRWPSRMTAATTHMSGNSILISVEVFMCNFERDLVRVLRNIQVYSSVVTWRLMTRFEIHVSLQWYCALLKVPWGDLILREKIAWPEEQQSTGTALCSLWGSHSCVVILLGDTRQVTSTPLCLSCLVVH